MEASPTGQMTDTSEDPSLKSLRQHMVLRTLWHLGQAGNTDVGHCFVKLCWLQLRYQIQDICSGYASHPPGRYCEQAHRFQNWFLFWHEDLLLALFHVLCMPCEVCENRPDTLWPDLRKHMQLWGKTEKRSKRDFARSWCVKRNGLRYLRNLYGGNGIHGYNWFILVPCHEYYVNHFVPSAGFGSKSAMCLHRGSEIRLLHRRLNTSQGYPGYSFLWAGSVSRLVQDSAYQRVPDCVSARRNSKNFNPFDIGWALSELSLTNCENYLVPRIPPPASTKAGIGFGL